MSVNKVILVGRVGKDPEVKTVNDKKVASFSLATSERYKDRSGEKKEKTTWHNIVAWSPLAEVIEKYVNKGDNLYIEGKIDNRSYDDKEGNKKYISEVVVRELTMLGGSKNAKPGSNKVDELTGEVLQEDGLPF